MTNRLVILSDIWGSRKGLWITSYLGYLQQYYDITYYDIQQLANIDVAVYSEENVMGEFMDRGMETAVTHLLKKEVEPANYLAFSLGGTITWKAALRGLPVESLYAVSSTRLRLENERPVGEVKLVYGENDEFRPKPDWMAAMEVEVETVSNFGHGLYTDEKIIGKVCKDLLQKMMDKQFVV